MLQVAGGFDAEDAFSSPPRNESFAGFIPLAGGNSRRRRTGIFRECRSSKGATERRSRAWQSLGCTIAPIDFKPFADAAELLYGGPWVAERLAAIGDFLDAHPDAIDPIVCEIISGGKRYDAVSAYRASYRLGGTPPARQKFSGSQWMCWRCRRQVRFYTVAEVAAEPIALNTNLGRYTNFTNLLDLCAIAVPSGFQSSGLPAGLTLMAAAWHDLSLCRLGAAFHDRTGGTLGATDLPLPTVPEPATAAKSSSEERVKIAVVGAHLRR